MSVDYTDVMQLSPHNCRLVYYFFYTHPPTTELYTLSLHDALPISTIGVMKKPATPPMIHGNRGIAALAPCSFPAVSGAIDRKSTRLNSSHVAISYAVFCLKKKNNTNHPYRP